MQIGHGQDLIWNKKMFWGYRKFLTLFFSLSDGTYEYNAIIYEEKPFGIVLPFYPEKTPMVIS